MNSDEELKKMLSCIFNLKRSRALSRMDIEMIGSIEMRWFTPGEMRGLVDIALSTDLLAKDERGELQPTFDQDGIKMPLTFKPSKHLLELGNGKNEDLVKIIAAMLAEHDGFDVKGAIAKMSRLKDEMNAHICAAGLTLCVEKGIDIEKVMEDTITKVEKDLEIEI